MIYNCEAKPLSRRKIRVMARKFREVMGIHDCYNVDVIEILDKKIVEIFPDVVIDIVPKEEMDNFHGLTYPEEGIIRIREDVYLGALAGVGRDKITIMHEVFHLLFHTDDNIVVLEGFARNDKNLPAYKNPEWQANCFAGEVLMGHDLIKDLSVNEIVEFCGVSYAAAKIQFKNK